MIPQPEQAVVQCLVPCQQRRNDLRFVGDQVIHTQLQQLFRILLAVDGPCRDGLTTQMDLLHHTSGDKSGFYAEKVCGRQVVVGAHAQRQKIPCGKVRVQLLHLAQGLVALRGDHAVRAVVVCVDQPHRFGLQCRCKGAGLDFNVQLCLALAQRQNLLQRGNIGICKLPMEPAPGIQLLHLRIGQVVDVGVAAGTPAQTGVVGHHSYAVSGHLHVQLNAGAAVLQRGLEGGHGIFRCTGGITPVVGDYRVGKTQNALQRLRLREQKIHRCHAAGDQRGAGHHSCQHRLFAVRGRGCTANGRLRCSGLSGHFIQCLCKGTLRRRHGAVHEQTKERQFDQQCRARKRQQGSSAGKADTKNDTIEQQSPAQQHQPGARSSGQHPAQCQRKQLSGAAA